MEKKKIGIIILILILCMIYFSKILHAQVVNNYTSASYILRDPIFAEAGPYTQSTNFKEKGALGQLVTGVSQSTNFILKSGYEYYSGQSVPSITMTLNTNSIYLGNILPGSIYKSPINTIITISSNAESGYNLYVNQNNNLTIPNTSYTIPPVNNGATTTSAQPYTSISYTGLGYNCSAYGSAALALSPIGLWYLGGQYTTEEIQDSSNNGNTATIYQAYPVNSAPIGNSTSMIFNGNSYVEPPNNLNNQSISTVSTVSLWFNTTSDGGLWGAEDALPGESTINNHAPALYVGTTGLLQGLYYNGSFTTINSSSTVNNGVWHNAVIVEDGNTQSIYLDGTLVGTLSGTIDASSMPYNTIGVVNTSGFSNGETSNYGWFYFNGDIADVSIFNTALTSSQISSLYSDTTSQSTYNSAILSLSPEGFWTMENFTTPKFVLDHSGNNNNAIYNSTPQLSTNGSISNGIKYTYFNGNSYIQPPNNLNNQSISTVSTVSLWFKTTSDGGLWGVAGTPPTSGGSSHSPALYVGTTGLLQGLYYNNTPDTINSSSPVNNGVWHNAVIVADGSTQSLYLDGSLVGTASGTIQTQNNMYESIGTVDTAGSWPNANGGWFYFNGDIADVALFNTALTASQISNLYNSAPSSTLSYCNSDFINPSYYRQFSDTPTEFASYSSIANNQTITVGYALNIPATQTEGYYTNTITYTVSGDY
jgi:hypothetical protein